MNKERNSFKENQKLGKEYMDSINELVALLGTLEKDVVETVKSDLRQKLTKEMMEKKGLFMLAVTLKQEEEAKIVMHNIRILEESFKKLGL